MLQKKVGVLGFGLIVHDTLKVEVSALKIGKNNPEGHMICCWW